MTEKQEQQIRAINRFLRAIYYGDISSCATIQTIEAEILEGRDINKNIDKMIFALDIIKESCNDGIAKLKTIKGE